MGSVKNYTFFVKPVFKIYFPEPSDKTVSLYDEFGSDISFL